MPAIVQQFNAAILNIGNGKVNLATDTIKVLLVRDYPFNSAHNILADVLSYEIEEQAGYESGGIEVENTSWLVFGSETKLTANNPVFTPVGGNLPICDGAVFYSDTSTEKNLISYVSFGESLNITEGNDLMLTILSEGIFNIVRGSP